MLSISPYIEINPNICSGKPVIKGTRITIQNILEYLASGMSFTEIEEDFSELAMPQILAAIAYAAKPTKCSNISRC